METAKISAMVISDRHDLSWDHQGALMRELTISFSG